MLRVPPCNPRPSIQSVLAAALAGPASAMVMTHAVSWSRADGTWHSDRPKQGRVFPTCGVCREGRAGPFRFGALCFGLAAPAFPQRCCRCWLEAPLTNGGQQRQYSVGFRGQRCSSAAAAPYLPYATRSDHPAPPQATTEPGSCQATSCAKKKALPRAGVPSGTGALPGTSSDLLHEWQHQLAPKKNKLQASPCLF